MTVDERARHRLYLKLEKVLGADDAGTLMGHLPPAGFADLATRKDLDSLEGRLSAQMEILKQEFKGEVKSLKAETESLARRLIMWTSSMVLAAAAMAFAAGRFV